jgi:capsular exopolysaccharide synthesis family protein
MEALTSRPKGLILNLREYLRVLRLNWVLVAAATMLGMLVAVTACLLMPATYTAKTQLFVAIQSSGSVTELQQGNTFSQARVQSYVRTARTPAVLQPAIDSLGLDLTPAALADVVRASSDPNTVLISITAEDRSAVGAAAIAQAVAESLIAAVDKLERPSAGGTSPVRLSVITPASVPTAPSSPDLKLNLVIGTICGLAVGVAGAFLRATLDTRIRGEADLIAITEAPVLGGIPYSSDAVHLPLLTQIHPQSPRAESFRQIRTNLQFANVSQDSKTVLVTSSLPGEGKSTTAANLAIALAESGQRVVLIDADLRRPMVDEYLGLERNVGLSTALIGSNQLDDLLQPWGREELYVLTSGQIPPNPSELLGSEAMRDLISTLEHSFDAVVIDAPPLLPVTDAAVLSQHVGGVLLVVGTQLVTTRDLEKSLLSLEMVQARLLGMVLNRLPAKGPDAYAYSYRSYGSLPQDRIIPKRSAREEPANDFDGILYGSNHNAPKRFRTDRRSDA